MGLEQMLKYRNSIYGFCAIWIVLFHVYGGPEKELSIVGNLISCGNMGVDIFLFLSGVCLSLSFKSKKALTISAISRKE
ncbi:MAG: hypothetical protein J1G06_01135 [Oscillospiraceae bacterium]|nr:hypothetical protein [Oscillospiraceae bacterium]